MVTLEHLVHAPGRSLVGLVGEFGRYIKGLKTDLEDDFIAEVAPLYRTGVGPIERQMEAAEAFRWAVCRAIQNESLGRRDPVPAQTFAELPLPAPLPAPWASERPRRGRSRSARRR